MTSERAGRGERERHETAGVRRHNERAAAAGFNRLIEKRDRI